MGPTEALPVDLNGGAHLVQRLGVAEPALVDRLVHDRQPVRLGQRHYERLLPVGHEARVDVGLQGYRAQLAARVPEADAATGRAVVDVERAADLGEDVQKGHHLGLPGAPDEDVAAGGQRRARPAGGLEPIRDRPVRIAAQPRHALDLDNPVGVHLDDRAHLLQGADQVDDLRLDRGVTQFGDAFGAYGGEQHLLGGPDAGVGQLELGAVQAVRRGQVEPFGGLVDHGAELAQRLQVEVDRAVADVAAAEVGDERVAEPVQQRAAEEDRDPAGSGVHVDLVNAGPLHVRRVEDHLAAQAVGDPDAADLAGQRRAALDAKDVLTGRTGRTGRGLTGCGGYGRTKGINGQGNLDQRV